MCSVWTNPGKVELFAATVAQALDRDADEPAKLLLQVKKNALLATFKEAEKILSQRIASKKTAVPPTPPPI